MEKNIGESLFGPPSAISAEAGRYLPHIEPDYLCSREHTTFIEFLGCVRDVSKSTAAVVKDTQQPSTILTIELI